MSIDPSKAHYFFHIPKTAGTTFTSILQQVFPTGQICHAENLLDLTTSSTADKTLFCGHYFHGIEFILQRPLIYLTFLRDPVARFVSHYHHVRRHAWHPFHQYAGTMESFLDEPVVREYCSNVQCRMLAATINPKMAHRWDQPVLVLLRDFEKSRTEVPDEEKLEMAIERLKTYAFVGLADRFQESINQLGLTWDGEVLNSSGIPTSSDSIERIRELNWLDLELVQLHTE